MPIYNKLVRDKIPEIIAASGKRLRTRVLAQDEYVMQLKIKLAEESAEYLKATDDETALEELADLLEVIHALAEEHGATWDELELMRRKKADQRGGFKERVYLIDVTDS